MAKVLLVEDDNNLREIYEARLMAEGYTIASARDGEEALVVAKNEKPDLVISDVMMPKISGFEMLDILRNTEGLKDMKVIMLTALGQSEDKTRADSLGADRYLVKSQVTLEDIVKAAHELLEPEAAAPSNAPVPATPTATPSEKPAAVPETTSTPPVTTPVADSAEPVAMPVSEPPAEPVEMAVAEPPVVAAPETTPSVRPQAAPQTTPTVPASEHLQPNGPQAPPVATAPAPEVRQPVSEQASSTTLAQPGNGQPVTAAKLSEDSQSAQTTSGVSAPQPAAAPVAAPTHSPVAEPPTSPAPSAPPVTTAPEPVATQPASQSEPAHVTANNNQPAAEQSVQTSAPSAAMPADLTVQSTAQEEGTVEQQIEEFINQKLPANEEPPTAAASDSPSQQPSSAPESASAADTTAPTPESQHPTQPTPVTNNQKPQASPTQSQPAPAAPTAQPTQPQTADPGQTADVPPPISASDAAMQNALQNLMASTQQPDRPSEVKAVEVPPAPPVSPPTQQEPTPAAQRAAQPDVSDDETGSVPIAKKKVIQPLDTPPKPDLNQLLAAEEAEEQARQIMNAPPDAANPSTAPELTSPNSPDPDDVPSQGGATPPANNGFDPNNVAL